MGRQIGDEWEKKHTFTNIITLIIKKDKVSYRHLYDSQGRNESTGSSTGTFNLSGDKLIIPKSLEKYMTKEKSSYTGENQLKIKLPKGKYMKLTIISTVHQYAAWARTIGTDIIKVSIQTKFERPTY